MTIQELRDALIPFTGEHIGAEIYFILKNGDALAAKFADLEADAQENLKDQFVKNLDDKIIQDETISLLPLSAADERSNVVYKYDLDDVPNELELLDTILEDAELPQFSFQNDNMGSIKGFLVLIGNDENKLALYKRHYPVSLIKKDSSFIMKYRSNLNRFVQLDSDIIKINSKFEFFKFNDEIFICDLKSLERFFGFSDIIKKEAQKGVDNIRAADILENPNFLLEEIENVSFSRKLTKVLSTSPVLGTIPNETVVSFVENHPMLKTSLKANANKDKLVLHTKKARTLFLKLLNDDYLISQLTSQYYDSLAKDNILTE